MNRITRRSAGEKTRRPFDDQRISEAILRSIYLFLHQVLSISLPVPFVRSSPLALSYIAAAIASSPLRRPRSHDRPRMPMLTQAGGTRGPEHAPVMRLLADASGSACISFVFFSIECKPFCIFGLSSAIKCYLSIKRYELM